MVIFILKALFPIGLIVLGLVLSTVLCAVWGAVRGSRFNRLCGALLIVSVVPIAAGVFWQGLGLGHYNGPLSDYYREQNPPSPSAPDFNKRGEDISAPFFGFPNQSWHVKTESMAGETRNRIEWAVHPLSWIFGLLALVASFFIKQKDENRTIDFSFLSGATAYLIVAILTGLDRLVNLMGL